MSLVMFSIIPNLFCGVNTIDFSSVPNTFDIARCNKKGGVTVWKLIGLYKEKKR